MTETTQRKQKFRVDIAILRLFAIIVVAGFHVYGMTFAEHLNAENRAIYKANYELITLCGGIRVAMPMFVLISGYLFAMQVVKGKYSGFSHVFMDKAKRILLPYFFFVILFELTYSGLSIHPFYTGSYWHLWFLPMLMWYFVITYLLRDLLLNRNGLWMGMMLIASFALMMVDKFVPMIMGAHNVSKWLFWFVAGFAVFRWDAQIESTIRRYHLTAPMILVYLAITCFFPIPYGEDTWYVEVGSLMAVLAIWEIVRSVKWERLKITQYLVWLSSLSFGIYIFHNWISAYAVSTTAQRVLPLNEWAHNHIIIFPFLLSVVVIGVSAVLSWIMRQHKYGKFLIG